MSFCMRARANLFFCLYKSYSVQHFAILSCSLNHAYNVSMFLNALYMHAQGTSLC